ncbi:hypothetical protein T439DRAFT_376854 [Meredithblackwellia eburnea MCA 4105]
MPSTTTTTAATHSLRRSTRSSSSPNSLVAPLDYSQPRFTLKALGGASEAAEIKQDAEESPSPTRIKQEDKEKNGSIVISKRISVVVVPEKKKREVVRVERKEMCRRTALSQMCRTQHPRLSRLETKRNDYDSQASPFSPAEDANEKHCLSSTPTPTGSPAVKSTPKPSPSAIRPRTPVPAQVAIAPPFSPVRTRSTSIVPNAPLSPLKTPKQAPPSPTRIRIIPATGSPTVAKPPASPTRTTKPRPRSPIRLPPPRPPRPTIPIPVFGKTSNFSTTQTHEQIKPEPFQPGKYRLLLHPQAAPGVAPGSHSIASHSSEPPRLESRQLYRTICERTSATPGERGTLDPYAPPSLSSVHLSQSTVLPASPLSNHPLPPERSASSLGFHAPSQSQYQRPITPPLRPSSTNRRRQNSASRPPSRLEGDASLLRPLSRTGFSSEPLSPTPTSYYRAGGRISPYPFSGGGGRTTPQIHVRVGTPVPLISGHPGREIGIGRQHGERGAGFSQNMPSTVSLQNNVGVRPLTPVPTPTLQALLARTSQESRPPVTSRPPSRGGATTPTMATRGKGRTSPYPRERERVLSGTNSHSSSGIGNGNVTTFPNRRADSTNSLPSLPSSSSSSQPPSPIFHPTEVSSHHPVPSPPHSTGLPFPTPPNCFLPPNHPFPPRMQMGYPVHPLYSHDPFGAMMVWNGNMGLGMRLEYPVVGGAGGVPQFAFR